MSWGGSFCNFAIPLTKNFIVQIAADNGGCNYHCINAAHEKYESNTMEWQQVIEINLHLLSRADVRGFEQMWEDGFWGQAIIESLKIGQLLIG